VPGIHDVGTEGDDTYAVMEVVEGLGDSIPWGREG
jgi:hypothetical protein